MADDKRRATAEREAAPASGEKPAETKTGLKRRIRALYHGDGEVADRFRFFLLAFDLVTIGFFVVSSMVPLTTTIIAIDFAIAGILFLDFVARAYIDPRPWRYFVRFTSIADMIVIMSLIAPAFFDNLAFLRVVRMLRLFRSYHVLQELRETSKLFRKNEEVVNSTVNLLLFVFVTSAVVFVVEDERNPEINNYFDALYFTVSTLTTTGFGDIVLTDTLGRALAVLIMIFGVALFLRLVQTIFRPFKVLHPCHKCGLERHDPDAVHCKHCGTVINIPTEGDWK